MRITRSAVAAVVMLATATGCTAQTNRSAPLPTLSTGAPSSVNPPKVEPLRSCSSLVGKAAYAAIRGMTVTCGFGGRDARSDLVSIQTLTCPDGAPFYVFYSTAADATDKAVYYGSEASLLFRRSTATSNPASERSQACT